MNIMARTTYEREYMDRANIAPRDVREMGREMGANALMKHYQAAEGTGSQALPQTL